MRLSKNDFYEISKVFNVFKIRSILYLNSKQQFDQIFMFGDESLQKLLIVMY